MSSKPPRGDPEPAPLQLRVEAKAEGILRCPYCHDDLPDDAPDWVACRRCLARHHAGCWKDCGRCATCSHGHALSVVGGRPVSPRRLSRARAYVALHGTGEVDSGLWSLPVATIVILLVAMLVGTAVWGSTRSTELVLLSLVVHACAIVVLFQRSGRRDDELLERVRGRVRAHRVEQERRAVAAAPLAIRVTPGADAASTRPELETLPEVEPLTEADIREIERLPDVEPLPEDEPPSSEVERRRDREQA